MLEHHDEFVGHVSGLVGSMATEFSFSVNSAEVAAPAPANGIPIVALANTAPPTTDEDAPAVVCGCDLFNWSVNPFMASTNGFIEYRGSSWYKWQFGCVGFRAKPLLCHPSPKTVRNGRCRT